MNWVETKLGDFLTVQDKRFKPDDKSISHLKRIDKIDFSGVIHLSEKPSNTDMILIKKGNLVISGINVEKGAMAIYSGEEDITATIHYSSYIYNPEKIDIDFLKFFLKSQEFRSALKEQVPGGIKTEIKPKHLLPLIVTIPKEVDDQKKIVKKLLKIQEKSEEISNQTSHQISLAKKLRQQVLTEAFSGEFSQSEDAWASGSALLEKIKAIKDKISDNKVSRRDKLLLPLTDKDHPYLIPSSWTWCRLGEICKIKVGSTPSRQNPSFWNGTISWVSSGEVANNFIYDTKEKITKAGFESTSLIVCPIGTVLVAMIGQGKTRGQTAILKTEATTNQNVAALIIDHQYLLPEFLWYFFLSRYEITRNAASGGNQPALNSIKISNTILPLPPVEEQELIVKKLNFLMTKIDELLGSSNEIIHFNESLWDQMLKESLEPICSL